MGPRRNREAGFTIIEMVVVLTLLAFAYALAAPAISIWFDGPRLDNAVAQVITSLREARARAITTSRENVFTLSADEDGITYSQSGDLTFFTDGSSSGARITLKSDKQSRAITIDWLTGKIREAAE